MLFKTQFSLDQKMYIAPQQVNQSAVRQGNIYPENTSHCTNVGLKLDQRRRRWANSKPTLVQYLVFAESMKKNVVFIQKIMIVYAFQNNYQAS